MTYTLLKFAHILGAILIGGGLISVWFSDLRSRQLRELPQFSEAIRNITVFYDGVVVPGAVLLLVSGTWLIVEQFGGWEFISIPWLAGMVVLFTFEFIEGNTVTRVYFMQLRRLTKEAIKVGDFTRELEMARAENIPTFTHFLDIPLLFLIIALGVIKPDSWTLFIVGATVAILIAAILTIFIPKLYPWTYRFEVKSFSILKHGEAHKLILDILRDAKAPISTLVIAAKAQETGEAIKNPVNERWYTPPRKD